MSDKQPLPTGRQLSALDPVFRERPHEYLDRLRAGDPVHRDAEVGRLFLTRFEDVKAVLSNRSLSVDPRKAPQDTFYRRNAVEEILRHDPPVVQTGRLALDPFEIGGMEVKAGEVMTASVLAAGHDPARHSDPHRFDIEWADTSHLAFGGGARFCLGAPLARAEAQIAIPLLFERFPILRLDPQHAIEHKDVPVFNGLRALWVRATRCLGGRPARGEDRDVQEDRPRRDRHESA